LTLPEVENLILLRLGVSFLKSDGALQDNYFMTSSKDHKILLFSALLCDDQNVMLNCSGSNLKMYWMLQSCVLCL